jgi:hypothetical protein
LDPLSTQLDLNLERFSSSKLIELEELPHIVEQETSDESVILEQVGWVRSTVPSSPPTPTPVSISSAVAKEPELRGAKWESGLSDFKLSLFKPHFSTIFTSEEPKEALSGEACRAAIATNFESLLESMKETLDFSSSTSHTLVMSFLLESPTWFPPVEYSSTSNLIRELKPSIPGSKGTATAFSLTGFAFLTCKFLSGKRRFFCELDY